MLISIVIPIYNVEAYLRECLNSVMAQTYEDWECILVDDASTDGSRAIAEEFCRRDSRFRLICHAENRGLSEARNSGIDNARGEYITFIDSDDYVGCDYLRQANEASAGCEIAIFPFKGDKAEDELCSSKEVLCRMLYQKGGVNSSFCGKLFDIRLFDSLRFTPGRTYEDLDLMDRIVVRAIKVKIIGQEMYYYRQRPGSILHTWSPSRLDVLKVTEEIETRLSGDAVLLKAARARRFAANFNILLLLRKNREGKSDAAAACRRQLRRLRLGVLMDSKARLKDRIGALIAYLI